MPLLVWKAATGTKHEIGWGKLETLKGGAVVVSVAVAIPSQVR